MKENALMSSGINRRDFLKSSAQAGLFLSLGSGKAIGSLSTTSYDIVIRNGTIVDGLNNKPIRADLGIAGERIRAIGPLATAEARTVLDASGKIVAPGFIDIHAHTDAPELLLNPRGESKIRQGVTTEISGNCGGSSFPMSKDVSAGERRYSERSGLTRDWFDLEGYFSRLKKTGLVFNYATLVGQGSIRELVLGDARRKPTAEELERMKSLVTRAMEQGAIGISTGLEYSPSGFASTEEVIELCRAAAAAGGFYATHVRSEDSRVVEAVAEAIHIAEAAKLPLEISHFKVCGTTYWWKLPKLFDLVDRAAERGSGVTADRYPYTAYNTGLSVFYPNWVLEGGAEAFVKRLKEPGERLKMKEETFEKLEGTPWENILLVDMDKEEDKPLVGKTIQQAADEARQDPYEFSCDLLIREGGNVSIIGFGMDEEGTEQVLKHPLVMVSSDGSALAPAGGMPHPRNYGTFPRFLGHYVRERKIMGLPEAIKKMTSMPAAKAGLKDRGAIRTGNWADLVVFDPATIADKATYTDPEQYPVGIDYVLVNGKVVIDHGVHSGELAGKLLYGPGKK
jgi:N-acyl-D-amino-acid deacylase